MEPKSNLLKNTLYINAASSAFSGLLCLVASDFLTSMMGFNSTVYLYVVGAGLILFAIDVALIARQDPIKPLFAKAIIAADISWVVGTVGLVIVMPQWFSITGMVLVDLTALMVSGFAIAQIIGYRRLYGTPEAQTA